MHIPVLLNEVVQTMSVKAGGTYIDGTLGQAGHASAVMRLAGDAGRLLGIDRDEEALARAAKNLEPIPGKHTLVHGAHGDIGRLAEANGFGLIDGVGQVDGILLDLGVSSDQLDTAERGFSFRFDGPLDMRMDISGGDTAADLVAQLSAQELADLFRKWGEEPQAMRFAKAIVAAREKAPLTTTLQLADLIAAVAGGKAKAKGKHPATRVFQALRMAVNQEMQDLIDAMEQSLKLLAPGGRLLIITFESLTDRVVKTFFRGHAGRMVALQQGGEIWQGDLPKVKDLLRKPLSAQDDEIDVNVRSRTAKLRAVALVGELSGITQRGVNHE